MRNAPLPRERAAAMQEITNYGIPTYVTCEPLMKFDPVELVELVGMCSPQQVNIGQALFENLFLNGIQLLMKVENNMKKSQMSAADKILLRKRVWQRM